MTVRHPPTWTQIVREFEAASARDAYGRLQVLLGLVEWTTANDVRDQTLQPFIEMLRRDTERAARAGREVAA